MVDPKEIQSIIERSDMVLNILKNRSKIEFKLGIVRMKVAFLGYQHIWGKMGRDEVTSELLDLGFDNLTLTQIVEGIVYLKKRVFEWKRNPKRITDPVKLAAMRVKIKNNVRTNVRKGKY